MNQKLSVAQTIKINAPLKKVWNVLTNPELIKEYLFGTETITDWKKGSEIIFQGEYENTKYRDKGTILENIPNEKIIYSYWSGFSGVEDKPENYSTIMYLFNEVDNNTTEFTWIQQGFASEKGYEHSKNGMTAFLEQIKSIAER